MANTNLKEAKAAKNDEFYTQFHDIEIEMNAYLEYDPDVFRGKTVLLPCDDPEWSNFTRYFAAKFDELGTRSVRTSTFSISAILYSTGIGGCTLFVAYRLTILKPLPSRLANSV